MTNIGHSVIIRADASLSIGSGHVIRCLSLADGLRRRGWTVSFLCRIHEGHLCSLIEENGYEVKKLPELKSSAAFSQDTEHSVWLGTSIFHDASETRAVLWAAQQLYEWLIVDHYGIETEWEEQVQEFVERVLVIDDLANRTHQCDLLVDQNAGRRQSDYKNLVPHKTRVLTGPKYALLRSAFPEVRYAALERRQKQKGRVDRVLISFGGMDPNNHSCSVVRQVLEVVPDIAVDIVLGSNAPNLEAMRIEVRRRRSRLSLHVDLNAEQMAQLMIQADLAIGAAGSTSWERCCLGLPSLFIDVAENQQLIAKSLQDLGAGEWIKDVNRLGQSFEHWLQNPARVFRAADDASNVCDGLGVERLVSELSDE